MRARVRKDASALTVQKQPSVPWSVRAAATLPRGARFSNPLFDDGSPAGTVAICDTGGGATLQQALKAAEGSDAALLIFDKADQAAEAQPHGYTIFQIDTCDLFFAANYPLPEADWLKADLQVGKTTPGALKPEQKPEEFLRVQTKQVETDTIGLLLKSARTKKSEDGTEERFILGVVLEPDSVDSQGDTISAEEIRHAAHGYMEEHGNVGLQHQVFVNGKVKIIESYIAPVEFSIGGELVKAGTWLMAFRVLDDSIWKAIKDGTLGGLSIGGTGLKIPLA